MIKPLPEVAFLLPWFWVAKKWRCKCSASLTRWPDPRSRYNAQGVMFGPFTLRITLSPFRRKCRRNLIIQRGVQTALAILLTPFTDGFPVMADVAEPVFIQVFIGKAPVKSLNKPVLCRLTGLDKPHLRVILISPQVNSRHCSVLIVGCPHMAYEGMTKIVVY